MGQSPSIFLSHAHEDKAFVHRLARQLTPHGVRVWIDEAEMSVGDSLLEKLTTSITGMEHLGVVISPHSARSEWVTREVEIAMREEIPGQTVKVLPLLLCGGELPPNLAGKLFADFTWEPAYADSLRRVLLALGVVGEARPRVGPDRLSELASSSALLESALAELRERGIHDTTAEALVSASMADVELSEFLSLVAQELHGHQLFGLAISLPEYIDKRGVGQEALDFSLGPGRLDARQMADVGWRMPSVKTPAAVRWCHSRLTSLIRSDPRYYHFLRRHIDTIIDQCHDEMADYLLRPIRGPSNDNLDSFVLVISNDENPWPFHRRVVEWIHDGYFDWGDKEGSEPAHLLYAVLNDHWDAPASPTSPKRSSSASTSS